MSADRRRWLWAVGGVLFLAVAVAAVLMARVEPLAALLAMLVVLPSWLATFWRDLRDHLVPDPLSWGSVAILLAGFAVAAVTTGIADQFLRACLAAAVFVTAATVMALVSSLGWGDVKLSASLGLALGWLGWPAVFWGAAAGLAAGAIWAGVLLASGRDRASHLPLGPCWIAGTVVGIGLSSLPLGF